MSLSDWMGHGAQRVRGMPRVVGLCGRKRAGKDTVAGVLCREAGYVRVAFADPLKRDVARFLHMTVDELEERKEEFRPVLDAYGWRMREVDDEHWICRASEDVARLLEDGRRVVITDVRFPNETAFVQDAWGGVMVRVVRTDLEVDDSLSSERHVDSLPCDHELRCPTGVAGLEDLARQLFREWGGA